MALNQYNFDALKNEAENLVFAELERQLGEYKNQICLCNECVVDMAGLALNVVKPLYRVSLLGTLYASKAMDEKEYAASIKKAVTSAIEKVRRNPSHE